MEENTGHWTHGVCGSPSHNERLGFDWVGPVLFATKTAKTVQTRSLSVQFDKFTAKFVLAWLGRIRSCEHEKARANHQRAGQEVLGRRTPVVRFGHRPNLRSCNANDISLSTLLFLIPFARLTRPPSGRSDFLGWPRLPHLKATTFG